MTLGVCIPKTTFLFSSLIGFFVSDLFLNLLKSRMANN